LKIIEVTQILEALGGGGSSWPDFREACEIQKTLEAVRISAAESRWFSPDEMETT